MRPVGVQVSRANQAEEPLQQAEQRRLSKAAEVPRAAEVAVEALERLPTTLPRAAGVAEIAVEALDRPPTTLPRGARVAVEPLPFRRSNWWRLGAQLNLEHTRGHDGDDDYGDENDDDEDVDGRLKTIG